MHAKAVKNVEGTGYLRSSGLLGAWAFWAGLWRDGVHACEQIIPAPEAACDPRRHRRRDAKRLVLADEIVVQEEQRRRSKRLDRWREANHFGRITLIATMTGTERAMVIIERPG